MIEHQNTIKEEEEEIKVFDEENISEMSINGPRQGF